MSRLSWLSLVVVFAACPSSSPKLKEPAAPVAAPSKPAAPPEATAELTAEQAQRLVDAIAQRRALRKAELAGDPLATPKSLDDVMEILRRDQEEFFPGALAFAAKQEGAQALALRAQIELAWGESELILEQMLSRTAAHLRDDVAQLEMKRSAGALSPEDTAKLETLKQTVSDYLGVSAALMRLGAEHVSAGAALAQQVIAAAPNDYQGYRVAADYYRLRGEWDRFDEMMLKLDEVNPKSNGGVFLRGMEALQRKKDVLRAESFFVQALERDPKFSRAQAHLTLAKVGRPEVGIELARLAAISPHHALVRWLGTGTVATDAGR